MGTPPRARPHGELERQEGPPREAFRGRTPWPHLDLPQTHQRAGAAQRVALGHGSPRQPWPLDAEAGPRTHTQPWPRDRTHFPPWPRDRTHAQSWPWTVKRAGTRLRRPPRLTAWAPQRPRVLRLLVELGFSQQ